MEPTYTKPAGQNPGVPVVWTVFFHTISFGAGGCNCINITSVFLQLFSETDVILTKWLPFIYHGHDPLSCSCMRASVVTLRGSSRYRGGPCRALQANLDQKAMGLQLQPRPVLSHAQPARRVKDCWVLFVCFNKGVFKQTWQHSKHLGDDAQRPVWYQGSLVLNLRNRL